uniref:Uncharacterized protein n=1 Tax=Chelonoidis abingdonii TaxID=106734 RepID=A0A8C0QIT6_CHEAB
MKPKPENVALWEPLWPEAPGNCPACYPLTPAMAFICRKSVIVAQAGRGVFIASPPSRKCPVAKTGHDEQVNPSSIFCKIYTPKFLLTTTVRNGAWHWMGNSKHTNLASSTIVKEGANKKVPGILVLYCVKVKLTLCQSEDVPVALPSMLMHLKPAEQFTPSGPSQLETWF